MHSYPLGKLPAADLLRLLAEYAPRRDARVILGPGLGHDAAVIAFGERYLVTKSDPITFATDAIGWYAAHVNANDIACLGAMPRWFVVTLLLPEGRTTPALVEEIFAQLAAACAELEVTLIGGHTEVTCGLDRPLVVGTMIGEVTPEKLIRSDGAQAGDALLLTKGIAVEGTALLARESRLTLMERGVPEDLLEQAARWLHQPGISVVRDAQVAVQAGRVHAMHDVTEGGFATGVRELVGAAGLGARLEMLPILPETDLICKACGLDPLGLIASGALLLAVAPEDAERIGTALRAAGIAAWRIGTVTEAPAVELSDGTPLPVFARDEVARWFEA